MPSARWRPDADDAERWADSVAARSRAAASTGCASWSTAPTGPPVGSRRRAPSAGADVEVLHAEPDGTNINAGCGSTHPEDLQRGGRRPRRRRRAGLRRRRRPGARRRRGRRLIDGDQIIARVRHRPARPRPAGRGHRGRDRDDQPGFRLAWPSTASRCSRCRWATASCWRRWPTGGLSLGGEQSGHVVFADLATTGDGLLTAVQLLDVVDGRAGRSPSWPTPR